MDKEVSITYVLFDMTNFITIKFLPEYTVAVKLKTEKLNNSPYGSA